WLPLIAFALPGVTVYDGIRLFLIVCPIFTIWVGIGAGSAWNWLEGRITSSLRTAIAAMVLSLPIANMILMHPCQLSSYGIQCGGLWGASRLGMELDYWGESLSPAFLRSVSSKIPQGVTVGIAPVSHPLYPRFL